MLLKIKSTIIIILNLKNLLVNSKMENSEVHQINCDNCSIEKAVRRFSISYKELACHRLNKPLSSNITKYFLDYNHCLQT